MGKYPALTMVVACFVEFFAQRRRDAEKYQKSFSLRLCASARGQLLICNPGLAIRLRLHGLELFDCRAGIEREKR
jgi:hypothetical protein